MNRNIVASSGLLLKALVDVLRVNWLAQLLLDFYCNITIPPCQSLCLSINGIRNKALLLCRCWTDLNSTLSSVHHVKERMQHSRRCRILIGTTVVFGASETYLRIVLAVLALASAGLAFALNELQKNFVFVDYVHADID